MIDLQTQAGGRLGQEAIQARVAAALSVCIEQLAQHLRRGKCGELWQLLLAEVGSRLEDLVAAQQRQQQLAAGAGAEQAGEAAAPTAGGKKGKKGSKGASKAAAAEAAVGAEAGAAAEAAAEEVAAAAASAARGLALLAQLVEHGRGCRVEAYEPLFKLAARLVKPEFLGGSSAGSGQQDVAAADGEQPGVAPLPYGASAVPADFQRPSLSAQVGCSREVEALGDTLGLRRFALHTALPGMHHSSAMCLKQLAAHRLLHRLSAVSPPPAPARCFACCWPWPCLTPRWRGPQRAPQPWPRRPRPGPRPLCGRRQPSCCPSCAA